MDIVKTPEEMLAWAVARRAEGQRVGLVPTMGFLHAGHRSLMAHARPQVDALVASIYVNPIQFGPNEDLDKYPRDPEGDLAKCADEGVDVVFLPETLYAPGFSTRVKVTGLTEGLCGASRPHHFEGVTTVVARLFGLTRCHLAVFGEKDFQQLRVIQRMAQDLAFDVDVQGAPIVRDEHGLALSSRNKYLSDDERSRGLSLSRALQAMQTAAEHGERDVVVLLGLGRAEIEADELEYLAVVASDDLQPLRVLDRPARALVAGHFGSTRLIDNVDLPIVPR